MKKDQAVAKLVSLTSNLWSPSKNSEKQLDTIRRVIGYNLRNSRQDISAVKLQNIGLELTTPKEKSLEFGKYAVNRLSTEDKFLVQRIGGKDTVPAVGTQMGDLRLPINPIESALEFRWNQKRGEQLGPFLTEEGRSIWFDFYYYEDKLTVRSQNGTIPHFLFSKARRNFWLDAFKTNQTVSLKAGYVWILAKLLSGGAGDNEYVGFNIKEGNFSIANQKKWSGQYLDFADKFTGILTLQLVQPEENASVFEGCRAAQSIDFQYPDEITFEWENGNLIKISGTDGKFKGYGNSLIFNQFTLPVTYGNGLNHLFIPCQTEPATWKADFAQSQIFDATGEAKINQSYWALPIVRVSNPTTLGEPENNGGWGLKLSSDLRARWIGSDSQQPDAIPNNTLLLLYPQALFFYSDKTCVDIAATLEIKQNFSCWNISTEHPARIPLSFTYKDEFFLVYYCHATEGETLMAGCDGRIQPDQPVFAEGSLVEMKDLNGWVVFQAKGKEIKINALLANRDALNKPAKPLALKNALMVVSQPVGLVLEGAIASDDRNCIETGILTLVHGLFRWKPILPDPYVSNLSSGLGYRDGGQTSRISTAIYAQIQWKNAQRPVVTYKGDLLLTTGVGIKPSNEPRINSLPLRLDEKTIHEIEKHRINGSRQEEKNKHDKFFDTLEKRLVGWKLLDVSTNMDLIGVSVSPGLFQARDDKYMAAMVKNEQTPKNTLIIKDLAVHTPLSMVHVFTLPQVQWEPVRTLPEDQNIAALGWFPENLSSASDGGPTRVIGISHELSPVIPDIVVHQIKDAFHKGEQAIALTTLSFGLKAGIALLPKNSSTRNADSLEVIQPEFPQKKMKGGIQINLRAESGSPKFESPSPGFEGLMVQTLNGYELFTGTELGLSVLGATFQPDASVETQFNNEFASDGSNPFVPVTRFDLSGYGASNFSEWENSGALASIGKVQFKIMVGRTAFEVVKFVSKIYPWGTTVTRSVTIERRSGGGVIRKDSGWQATQAGIFNFITPPAIPNNPYQFRPGIFRGCFDIKNIRPASNNIIQFSDPANGNMVELAPVYFDTNVLLEGQIETTIFSRGVLGFIQLAPKPDASVNPWLPRLLSKEALKKLINDQGAIGGPVDTLLNIGNSGFRFRATRFEVDVVDNAGTPNFIGVVRGQPILPNNGSWSVIKMAAPGNSTDPQEAASADVSRGTPVFLENIWYPPVGNVMNVGGAAGPYRFADPADLFAPQPRFDYGFMQNTGSQAFLFRRPVIVSGTNEISSALKPAFADPFALFTTKGVFPPIDNVIEFPSSNYKLLVQPGTGKLKINTPVNISNPRTALQLARDGTNQIVIEYDQSKLRYNLNYDDWNAELDTFYVWTSLAGISKLFGSRFSLRAGTTQQSKLVDVVSLMKPEIRDALAFIPGMNGDQRVKDIDLGMTNQGHEIKIVAGYSCGIEIDILTGDIEVHCLPKELEEISTFENKKSISLEIEGGLETGIAVDLVSGSANFALDVSLGAALQGKIPIGGLFFVVLGLEVEIGWSILPESSASLEIGAYAGVGMGYSFPCGKAEGFIAGGILYVWEPPDESWLWLVKLEAEIDIFKIINVSLTAELQGYISGGSGIASGEVAVNVSIFLIINISASYAYEAEERLE